MFAAMNSHPEHEELSERVMQDNAAQGRTVDRLCWALGLVGLCYLIAMCAAWQC